MATPFPLSMSFFSLYSRNELAYALLQKKPDVHSLICFMSRSVFLAILYIFKEDSYFSTSPLMCYTSVNLPVNVY
jgi:hypothetical protein